MSKLLYNDPLLKNRRRELRKQPTESEKILWKKLNKNQLLGYRFFRQYSAGPYILDFYCPKLRLAIELDGWHHKKEESKIYDAERNAYLQKLNIETIRFWNDDMRKNTEGVLRKIKNKMELQKNNPLALPYNKGDKRGL